MTPDEIDRFEERAAILEFDGNMTRKEAEIMALEEIKRRAKWKQSNRH